MDINYYRQSSKRLRNKNEHKCTVTLEDYRSVAPKLELLKRLSEIEQSIYAVYDMHRCDYLLVSDEQKKLWGVADKTDKANIDSEAHYSSIHPEDLPFVLETDNLVYKFFAELPISKKLDYKLVYDFRTKNADGVYVRYIHQTTVLELDNNGKSWLMLVVSHLLFEKENTESPQRRMINMKTGKLYLFDNDETSNSKFILTKRETEILNLIGQGYNSITISDKLNISINMSITIRKATFSDISNLTVLKQQVWISTYATDGLRDELSNYVLSEFTLEKVEQAINDNSKLILVAEVEKHIVGCAEISLSQKQPIQNVEECLEITVLYVLEICHGKGIGKMLLEACLKKIKEFGFNKTWLTVYHKNEKAIQFYVKHNFKHVGDEDFIMDGNRYKNLVMLREILE